jgi:hypothetical protein
MHIQPHQSPCLFRFLVAASHKLRINHSMKNNMYTRYTKKHTLYLQKNLLLPFIHSTWEGYSVIHGKLGMHTGVGSHFTYDTTMTCRKCIHFTCELVWRVDNKNCNLNHKGTHPPERDGNKLLNHMEHILWNSGWRPNEA